MPIEIKNARITGTFLGVEDHGIFTTFLYLDYGGGRQGFGGYTLDKPIPGDGYARVGRAAGITWLMRVLEVVGVESWEALPGKYVRVKADTTKVHAIGHMLKDEWFDPAEVLAEKD
jgi:hypothetical protein